MTTRLKAARLTNDTLVSKIDDSVGSFEAAASEIIGINIDEDVTEGLSVDNSGRVTKQTMRQVATVPAIVPGSVPPADGLSVGLGLTNSSNSNRARLGLFWMKDGDSYRPAFGVAPMGTPDIDADGGPACLAVLLGADGALMGRRFGNGVAGLLPYGSGNSNEFMNANGVYASPAEVSKEFFVLSGPRSSATPNTNFRHGYVERLRWATEDKDPSGMHAANAEAVTILVAGHYKFTLTVDSVPTVGTPTVGGGSSKSYMFGFLGLTPFGGGIEQTMGLVVKRFSYDTTPGPTQAKDFSIEVSGVYDCAAGDTVAATFSCGEYPVNEAILATPYTIPRAQFSGFRVP